MVMKMMIMIGYGEDDDDDAVNTHILMAPILYIDVIKLNMRI